MYQYLNAFTNRSGDSLPGYFARLYDSDGNQADLFADANGTPISTVSGVENAALSDDNGMFRWFVANGTYDMRFYDGNDVFVSVEIGVPMFEASQVLVDLSGDEGATLVGTPTGTVQDDIDARPTAAALAAPTGGELVALESGLTLQATYDRLPSDDNTRYWFAGEYLSTFRAILATGSGANITMSGDSTTAGTGLSGGYIPDVHLRSLGRDYGADYLVINNRGQAGKDTADWLADYLAGDIALATNLYILRWGVNDPDTALKGLTVAQSLANYETALQTIRAAKGLTDSSILIMAPNACIGRGRTEAWFREMVEGLRKLARQYECAFFDTFNYTRDALQNIDIGWDDVLADGTMAIHPLAPVSGMIYQEVARVLFAGLGPNKSNHFHNRRGATGQELLAATLPAAFEYGITMDRVLASNGFPADGFVITQKNNFSGTNALQTFWNNDGPQFRVGGTSWLDWLPAGSIGAAITLGSNWTHFGSVTSYTARKSGNKVGLTGIIAPGVGATTTAFTLPAGFRPVGRSIHLAAITNGGMLHFSVATTGVATLDSVPTTWLSLEGLCFEINQ